MGKDLRPVVSAVRGNVDNKADPAREAVHKGGLAVEAVKQCAVVADKDNSVAADPAVSQQAVVRADVAAGETRGLLRLSRTLISTTTA